MHNIFSIIASKIRNISHSLIMLFFIQLALFAQAIFCGLINQSCPITFLGSPFAISSISSSGTLLTTHPSGNQASGAQFLYQKNTGDSKAAGLVTVYLGRGSSTHLITLQTGFDAIDQACSCYYIDVQALDRQYQGVFGGFGADYFILFEGPNYSTRSGMFTIINN